MTDTLTLILLVIALVLAIIAVVQSRGTSLVAWSATVGFGALVLARLL